MHGGAPVARAAKAFLDHPQVDVVRVVVAPSDRDLYDRALAPFAGERLLNPVEGGDTRQESALAGLRSLRKIRPERVLIHDGARPHVRSDTISAVIAALDKVDGAFPALEMTDCVWRLGSAPEDGLRPLDRAALRRAQTPQGFQFDAILSAHEKHMGENLPDDASVAHRAGLRIGVVPGDPANRKLTSPEDLARERPPPPIRIGQGVDVHAFREGKSVRLCGVDIPFDRSLAGHSDADVALHAVADALYGALGEDDIGAHFPPSDSRWKDADSRTFLTHATDRADIRGYVVTQVDVTLVCEEPRIGPYRSAMRARTAEALGIGVDRVSVKATTSEGLGFTGRREGVAAIAIVMLTEKAADAP